ncbi:uncharacterized protein LOC124309914 [Neodiprion virginianus]|uniref:uncharacterized protein LOC124309914 n=1 Tax=Neodiprion virginianus TaxID=2961670 RepID=UPI001EE7305A|nr:uncharacterized protein LOC124309914 [Neodiprion virginianus]
MRPTRKTQSSRVLSGHFPTSEVGYRRDAEPSISELPSETPQRNSDTLEDRWQILFENQNKNMTELIRKMQSPTADSHHEVTFPLFNPDEQNINAQAWCPTASLCMQEQELQGSKLVNALSEAMKGSAASWFPQISFNGMTWEQFKNIFLARYEIIETPAATLLSLYSGQPNGDENIAAYSSRVLSVLIPRLQLMNSEEIAVWIVLSHVAQLDPRLERLALTTEISSRTKLQQELMAVDYRKRAFPFSQAREGSSFDSKRLRTYVSSLKCFHCGKFGHKISECRSRSLSTIPDNFGNLSKKIPSTAVKSSVTCFKCGEVGHVSTSCKKSSGSGQNTLAQGQMECRVNSCSIQPTFGELLHSGEKFSFCFDSGVECSLIKESIAKKISGKRQNFVVILSGIGPSSIQSVIQILAQVTINDHCLEILFHVIHDDFLSTEILVGREILSLGYSIEMTVDSLVLKRIPRVNVCEVDYHSFNFDEIKTDVSEFDKRLLVDVLNKFRSTFVIGTPKSRVTTGQLEIRLLDPNRTVQRRPYRLLTVERQIVRDKIKELQEENVIRPSCSPFASPIILVKKKMVLIECVLIIGSLTIIRWLINIRYRLLLIR